MSYCLTLAACVLHRRYPRIRAALLAYCQRDMLAMVETPRALTRLALHSHDLPKKQAEAVLGDLVTLTTRHLKRGDKIRLTGLGILQVRKRAARMGRNPAV